ncbi:PilV family protein [Methylomarinum vadi]|uniref:hypothetical protein n=1 Tax=Methylomarinum vadi TaxID=438855 RepID=UPI0004DF85AC|nr:hypothetical protein [Methylomarinum vadi]
MHKLSNRSHRGIGLIEVLITTVVIAVGLLAVASLQSGLTSESGLNKTRSEAKTLCDNRIEQLRDALSEAGYNAIASSTADETITGTNEVFTRSWSVDDLPDAGATDPADQVGPERKRISVTCSWGAGGANERVVVQSVISYEDLGAAALAAITSGLGGLNINDPSTNANSSDEIIDATDVPIPEDAVAGDNGLYSLPGLEEGQYVKDNGDGTGTIVYLCSSLIPFENGLYTRRVHYKPATTDFKEAIELFEDNEDAFGSCTRRIRFNGGIILPIKGVVYSRATTGNGANVTLLELRDASNTQLFTFNATESGSYCVFNPEESSTSAPYICYVGGNCVNGPVGTTATTDGINFSNAGVGDNTVVTQCPAPVANPSPTPPYPTGVYQEVGPGGWRGKVGLLGIPESSKNVCFAEELIEIQQQQADQHTLDTARNYFTRRVNNGVESNEGINRPYNCHDMVIINGQSTTVQVHDECIQESASIVGLALASKNIQRNLTGSTINSVILTPDITFCTNDTPTEYTIAGTVTNAASVPVITINDGSNSANCTATISSYSCTISTTANAVTITGTDSNGTSSCFMTPPDSPACELKFTQIEGQRTITAAIIKTGNGTLSNITVSGTDATCVGTECTVANDWTGTLTATATCSGTPTSVSATSATIAADAVTTSITMPECTDTVVNRTISGSISISNQVDNLESISVNLNGSVCGGSLSKLSNSTGSYSCTVPDATNVTIEITIYPVCSNKQYTIYANTPSGQFSSTGDGVLTINLGTISSDLVIDGSVTRSNLNCN